MRSAPLRAEERRDADGSDVGGLELGILRGVGQRSVLRPGGPGARSALGLGFARGLLGDLGGLLRRSHGGLLNGGRDAARRELLGEEGLQREKNFRREGVHFAVARENDRALEALALACVGSRVSISVDAYWCLGTNWIGPDPFQFFSDIEWAQWPSHRGIGVATEPLQRPTEAYRASTEPIQSLYRAYTEPL